MDEREANAVETNATDLTGAQKRGLLRAGMRRFRRMGNRGISAGHAVVLGLGVLVLLLGVYILIAGYYPSAWWPQLGFLVTGVLLVILGLAETFVEGESDYNRRSGRFQ